MWDCKVMLTASAKVWKHHNPRISVSRDRLVCLWAFLIVMDGGGEGGVVVLIPTFYNISVISWWSVLLMEETGVQGENHRPVACPWEILSHNDVSSTPHHEIAEKSDDITPINRTKHNGCTSEWWTLQFWCKIN